jgi:hypothetical protein
MEKMMGKRKIFSFTIMSPLSKPRNAAEHFFFKEGSITGVGNGIFPSRISCRTFFSQKSVVLNGRLFEDIAVHNEGEEYINGNPTRMETHKVVKVT